MNPLFRIDFSISDSLKIVRKSVLIYETIIHFHLSESWTKKVEGEAMDSLRGKLPWWF